MLNIVKINANKIGVKNLGTSAYFRQFILGYLLDNCKFLRIKIDVCKQVANSTK